MDASLKQRLVGAAVLVALAVIFLPMLVLGALGGAIAAWLFRHAEPFPPRRKYSWELEEEEAHGAAAPGCVIER